MPGTQHPTSIMRKKTCNFIVTEVERSQQLCLALELRQKPQEFAFQKRQRAQILSTPGASPKQRDRYRVVLAGKILGDRLAIDEAWNLAGGAR